MHANLKPIPIGSNGSVTLTTPMIGAFLAVTSGTMSITDAKGNAVLTAFPVTAGQSVNLYMSMASGNVLTGGTVTLAGLASGTLLVR